MLQASDNSIATYHNGKYYLATRMNFNDGKLIGSEGFQTVEQIRNNVLLELDVKTGEVTLLRGLHVVSLNSINHKLFSRLVICAGVYGYPQMGMLTETGSVFGLATEKFWLSPETDLGEATSEKLVKELHVKTNHPFTFTVTSDRETKTVTVPKSSSVSKVKLNVRGTVFHFSFATNLQDAYISNPQLIYGVL